MSKIDGYFRIGTNERLQDSRVTYRPSERLLVAKHKSLFGRVIGFVTSNTLKNNKAAYRDFKHALTQQYGDLGVRAFGLIDARAQAGKDLRGRDIKVVQEYIRDVSTPIINNRATDFASFTGPDFKAFLAKPVPSPGNPAEIAQLTATMDQAEKRANDVIGLTKTNTAVHKEAVEVRDNVRLTRLILEQDKLLHDKKAPFLKNDPNAVVRHQTARGMERLYSYSEVGCRFEEAVALIRTGIAPSPAVRIGHYSGARGDETFSDANERSAVEKFSSGNFNAVAKITYKNGKEVIYQRAAEEQPELPPPAGEGIQTGIPRDHTRYPHRAVATYKLAELLKTDEHSLVPKTHFGLHKGQLGMVMDLAPGKEPIAEKAIPLQSNSLLPIPGHNNITLKDQIDAYINMAKSMYNHPTKIFINARDLAKADGITDLKLPLKPNGDFDTSQCSAVYQKQERYNIHFEDPVFQRQTNQLQLLDFLCAQIDRHARNYFVDIDAKNRQVKGVYAIDNDQAFGKKIETANDYTSYRWALELPPIVDKAMAAKINALDKQALDDALGDLLTGEEMDALVARLDVLKNHINSLPADRRIDADQWGPATARLQTDRDTSYFAREKGNFAAVGPENLLPVYAAKVGKDNLKRQGVSL